MACTTGLEENIPELSEWDRTFGNSLNGGEHFGIRDMRGTFRNSANQEECLGGVGFEEEVVECYSRQVREHF